LLKLQLSVSVSLRFNGHFPGGPGLAGTRMSQLWSLLELRVMEVVVTTGAIRRAKLQSEIATGVFKRLWWCIYANEPIFESLMVWGRAFGQTSPEEPHFSHWHCQGSQKWDAQRQKRLYTVSTKISQKFFDCNFKELSMNFHRSWHIALAISA